MKLRGYVIVYDGGQYFFYAEMPEKALGSKVYTFTIDVPHNLTELKTVENIEEVKE